MLRAYIDDSIHNREDGIAGGVYALAGYVSDTSRWAEFADEWDAILHEGPHVLEYLHTSEAHRLTDPKSMFYGWTSQERDNKLLLLARAINRRAFFSVQTAMRPEHYREILGPITKVRVYYFLFYSIIAQLIRATERFHPTGKIEIYFDEKGDESVRGIEAAYEEFMADAPAHLRDKIASRPEFKNDRDITPLQAADLMAWYFRRNIYEDDRNRKFESPVWDELLNLPRLTGIWDRSKLAEMVARRLDRAGKRVLTGTATFPDPSSGWGYPWKA